VRLSKLWLDVCEARRLAILDHWFSWLLHDADNSCSSPAKSFVFGNYRRR
jgi:hypothetical protein